MSRIPAAGNHVVGSPRGRFSTSDGVEVGKGSVIAAGAAIVVAVLHHYVDLTPELEAAAWVLAYAGVRAAYQWLADTQAELRR